MEAQNEKPAKGKILVAEPFLGDPSFERTLILLTEHNEDGTVGFVLNRPLNLKVHSLFENFPQFNAKVYYGGPVQKESLYFIHSKGELIPDSIELGHNIYWSGRLDIVKDLIELGLINTSEIKFFLGYSGWGAKQLESELNENTWLVLKQDNINVLEDSDSIAWKSILNDLGGDYRLWANSPSDPLMN